MKLKMLTSMEGSPDHINVHWYKEGEVYSKETDPPMSEELAEIFLEEGWAEPAKDGFFKKSTAQPSVPAPAQDTSPRRPESKEFTISLDPHFFR